MISDKEDKIIAKLNSAKASYMSNAKWKKLFAAFDSFAGKIDSVKWKFVFNETASKNNIRGVLSCLEGNRFGDCHPSPYAELRYIDWILIPAEFEDPRSDNKRALPKLKNDIVQFKMHLKKHGEFPIFETKDGLMIKGYEW